METTTANIRVLLMCVALNRNFVHQDSNGDYHLFNKDPKGTTVSVENRLKYELYGEFPLSEVNQHEYENHIRPAIKFRKYRSCTKNIFVL